MLHPSDIVNLHFTVLTKHFVTTFNYSEGSLGIRPIQLPNVNHTESTLKFFLTVKIPQLSCLIRSLVLLLF